MLAFEYLLIQYQRIYWTCLMISLTTPVVRQRPNLHQITTKFCFLYNGQCIRFCLHWHLLLLIVVLLLLGEFFEECFRNYLLPNRLLISLLLVSKHVGLLDTFLCDFSLDNFFLLLAVYLRGCQLLYTDCFIVVVGIRVSMAKLIVVSSEVKWWILEYPRKVFRLLHFFKIIVSSLISAEYFFYQTWRSSTRAVKNFLRYFIIQALQNPSSLKLLI